MTCSLFGMKRTALAVSTSNHPVLDIMASATAKQKPRHSFQAEAFVCPACQGKHRPHTYADDCKRAKPEDKKKSSKKEPEPKKKTVGKKLAEPDTKVQVKPSTVPTTRSDVSPEAAPTHRPDGTPIRESSGPSSGHRERPAEPSPEA